MNRTAIRSKAIRDAARGEDCTLQIAGICENRTDTTVGAHLPDESHGMARKSDDLSLVFADHNCHAVIDGRMPYDFQPGEREWYCRRALIRTWRRLVEKGVITVKGVA